MVKYLYKYVYKDHDHATITLSQSGQLTSSKANPIDEIKMYLNAKYVSSSESIWRIFHYKMYGHISNVQRLTIHLPNQQSIIFQNGENLHHVVENTITHKITLLA